MTETREKILAFLNIDLKKKIDKLIMKIITWFHVGFCVFVFGAGARFGKNEGHGKHIYIL